jgi:hypothetical protein
MRSECGARARSRKPLPGGSGPPLGRHDDRSPRSSVDSRQIEAGNARQIGSQETRELELSQRRMRSPWRVPRRSAERRAARDMSRCRAADEVRKFAHTCLALRGHGRCAYRRSASLQGRQKFVARISRCSIRATRLFRTRRGSQSSDAKTHRESDFVFPPPRRETARGRGTARRAVEGAYSREDFSDAEARHCPRPFHHAAGAARATLRVAF